jgi:N-methylhydantoinase B/oxoprolinase/acetone carboxylase alpha subunit
MFKMFCGVYMIMVFDPQIMFNDGFYDLMEVRIPEGSLLKPLKPGGAVLPHARPGPHLRHPRRPARPG